MHVIRSWISFPISCITSRMISVTTIGKWEFVHSLHVTIRFYYSIRVVALAASSSMDALGVTRCYSDTSRRQRGISGLHFLSILGKASHFITLNCIIELMTFMCVCAYVYVLYTIPVLSRFYCVHKPHYHHFYCVHNNVLQHVLYIMFYCTLSEMTRIEMINQYTFETKQEK